MWTKTIKQMNLHWYWWLILDHDDFAFANLHSMYNPAFFSASLAQMFTGRKIGKTRYRKNHYVLSIFILFESLIIVVKAYDPWLVTRHTLTPFVPMYTKTLEVKHHVLSVRSPYTLVSSCQSTSGRALMVDGRVV